MDGALIYAKTPRGVEEVAARSGQLSLISRRVLIIMDGRRTVEELSLYVRPGEIDGIVTQLESAGLAEKAGAAAPATVAPRTLPPSPEQNTLARSTLTRSTLTRPTEGRTITATTLEDAKRRAVRELHERVGRTGDAVAANIEGCRTVDEFRESVREAERCIATALGPAAGQEYLRVLRRRS